jgi:hypothetical protein
MKYNSFSAALDMQLLFRTSIPSSEGKRDERDGCVVNKHLPKIKVFYLMTPDRLCGLVARVLGYRSGGPGSIPGTTRKNVVGLERGPLSLVSTTEEQLERKVAAPA